MRDCCKQLPFEIRENCKYDINVNAMYFNREFTKVTRETESENLFFLFSLFFKMKFKHYVCIYFNIKFIDFNFL